MNKLEQLKKITKVVADTGDIQQIKQYSPADATTNPSLLLKAAAMPEYNYVFDKALKNSAHLSGSDQVSEIMYQLSVGFGLEILKTIPGRISTEVDARLSFNARATIKSAKKIIGLYEQAGIKRERILIKVAATWEGIQAAKVLQAEGIFCNLTLIFHMAQAIACAESGVTLISPFVGRITDWYKKAKGLADFPPVDEDDGVLSVREIYAYFKAHKYETTVMGASFRHVGQVEALAGCDALTIAPTLLSELMNDNGNLEQKLSAKNPQVVKAVNCDEENFRWLMNECPMATEKLAEGIRNFGIDTVKLEDLIKQKISK